MKAVHHDLAHAIIQRELKLLGRLVVAVEVDAVRWEVGDLGHGKLPAGDDIQAHILLGHHAGDRRVDERLGCVCDAGPGVAFRKFRYELPAHAPQSLVIVYVKGRAELRGQVRYVTTAQRQVIVAVHSSRNREKLDVIEGHSYFLT